MGPQNAWLVGLIQSLNENTLAAATLLCATAIEEKELDGTVCEQTRLR